MVRVVVETYRCMEEVEMEMEVVGICRHMEGEVMEMVEEEICKHKAEEVKMVVVVVICKHKEVGTFKHIVEVVVVIYKCKVVEEMVIYRHKVVEEKEMEEVETCKYMEEVVMEIVVGEAYGSR